MEKIIVIKEFKNLSFDRFIKKCKNREELKGYFKSIRSMAPMDWDKSIEKFIGRIIGITLDGQVWIKIEDYFDWKSFKVIFKWEYILEYDERTRKGFLKKILNEK